MKDRNRDSLQTRLHAGDPYQGESMPAADAVRIRARMRAGAAGARVRPNWIPAVAVAAMVAIVALGIWVGSRPSTTGEPLASPVPATSDGHAVTESPSDPISEPESPLVREPARTGLAVVQPAPALPAPAERGLVVVAPPETADTAHVVLAETAAAVADAPPTEARRIQFTARRGTRIVWTLDPAFEPSMTRDDAPPARHQQGANDKW